MKVSNAFQLGLLGGLGVLTALLIGNMVITIASVLTYVFAAIFIALGLDPIVSWLEQKGLKRPLGIGAVFLVVFGSLAGILTAFAPALISESAHLIESAPGILESFSQLPLILSLDAKFDGAISRNLLNWGSLLGDSSNWPTLLGGVVQLGLGIVNGVVAMIIIIILSLYFMASLKSFKRFVYGLVPSTRRETFTEIAEQIAHAVGRYVIGQLSIAAINALAALTVMLILNVPYAVVLGAITFVLALVPLVGSLIAGTLVTAIALTVNPTAALIYAIYYLIYMQIEAYVISPRVMNKAVAIPGAVVVIAALAGGALLGILGALVAIPVAASVILILRQVVMPRQNTR